MATLAEKLAQAKATYNKNVSNKESSTIINRSKAAVDAAQKAYDNQPAAPTGPNDAQNRARLEAEAKAAAAKIAADRKARAELDPGVIAAKTNQAAAAAEVTATNKSIADARAALATTKATNIANADTAAIAKAKAEADAKAKAEADAKALTAKIANDKATAAKIEADAAAKAATDAILAAQVTKTAEAAALVLKLQEEARLAALEAARLAEEAAAKDAQIAATAQELADAQRAIDAANAATAAAEAAGAAAVAAAAANINQSGDVAIPTTSVSDAASAMYAQELKDKAEKEKVLLERQSVSETLIARFKEYKLESLADTIKNLAIEGANEDTITLALQGTTAYKERFKANDARVKANLRVLSPSEYLKNEDAYRQTLREYGLNKYDTDEYVTKFIENDTAPEELSGRIALGVNRIQNADPLVVKTLKAYGVTDTDMLEYVLDTKNKLPELTRKVQIAEVGAAARAQGLNAGTTEEQIAGYKATSEALVNQGVDQAMAQKGYSAIAGFLPEADKLSNIYSNMEGYGQTKAEQEVFGKMASAQRAREALKMREIGTFSGSAGTTKGSLGSKATGQY